MRSRAPSIHQVVAAPPAKAPGATRPVGGQKWEMRFTLEQVFAVVSPLGLLVIWQILSNLHVLDPRIFSSPTGVAVIMWQLIQNGELPRNTWITLVRLVEGSLAGGVPGLLVGLIIGLFRLPRAIINPIVSAIYGLPRVALFPLVLLIVGLNEQSNIIMVALGPFFTMLIGVAAAVQHVDPIYLRVARSFHVNTRSCIRKWSFPPRCRSFSAPCGSRWD